MAELVKVDKQHVGFIHVALCSSALTIMYTNLEILAPRLCDDECTAKCDSPCRKVPEYFVSEQYLSVL